MILIYKIQIWKSCDICDTRHNALAQFSTNCFFTYSYFVKLIKQIKYNMCTYDKKVLNICAYTGWNTLQVSYHNLFDKQY